MTEQMNSLRVNSRAKRIQVNDQGEYITLDFGDQRFLPDLLALMDEFKAVETDYGSRAAEIDAMPENTQDESTAKIAATAAFNLELCTHLKRQVDEAFRDDVCRKVFGNITPSVAAFAEFFDQLSNIIRALRTEQDETLQKRIEHYTAKYTKEG